jgi:hypothetical protein
VAPDLQPACSLFAMVDDSPSMRSSSTRTCLAVLVGMAVGYTAAWSQMASGGSARSDKSGVFVEARGGFVRPLPAVTHHDDDGGGGVRPTPGAHVGPVVDAASLQQHAQTSHTVSEAAALPIMPQQSTITPPATASSSSSSRETTSTSSSNILPTITAIPAATLTHPVIFATLIPRKKLTYVQSAKHMHCQLVSFARHKQHRNNGDGGTSPRFVIVQSTDFNGKKEEIPYTFNRAAWAEAFGHEFVHVPPPTGLRGYSMLASNKPRVLLAELRRHLGPLQPPRTVRAEWIVWMDADTFVNPDDPPDLDALVRTVSEDKVLLVTQAPYVVPLSSTIV